MQEQNRTSTTADVAERMTSRISNSMVIAAGILALGIYWSGDEVEVPTYQAVSTPDGRVVRVNTQTGSVVSCDAARCSLIYLRGDELDRVREAEEAERVRAGQPGATQPALPPAGTPAPQGRQGASPSAASPAASPAPQPPAQPPQR